MRSLAALVALTIAALPAAAQPVCRANRLGGVSCPAPRPEPRPILEADTQALDRVRREIERQPDPVFIPSWRANRLGTTPLGPGERGRAGPGCRADSFGNLRCP
jgi:hypothetical protein